jgi:hypothetical protein
MTNVVFHEIAWLLLGAAASSLDGATATFVAADREDDLRHGQSSMPGMRNAWRSFARHHGEKPYSTTLPASRYGAEGPKFPPIKG